MNKPDPAITKPAAAGAAPAPLVDVEAGVERLMGNRPVYLRALARFRHDYRSAGAAIGTAIETGNLALAQRLFTVDANVRNVKAFFSVKRAKFDPRLPLPLPTTHNTPHNK